MLYAWNDREEGKNQNFVNENHHMPILREPLYCISSLVGQKLEIRIKEESGLVVFSLTLILFQFVWNSL